VSGDLESATTVASFMEGFWGMGSTVSSYSTARRMEVGSPGGGAAGRNKKGDDPEKELRRALADRIEDRLHVLLDRVEDILAEHRGAVLTLAHALETHKTLSGDDVVAVLEHTQGPFVDGRVYADPAFIQELEDYHAGAASAHREHGPVPIALPATTHRVRVPQAVATTANGNGIPGSAVNGSGVNGSGVNGSGANGSGANGNGVSGNGTGTGVTGVNGSSGNGTSAVTAEPDPLGGS
jgi:cell division protease FtsH